MKRVDVLIIGAGPAGLTAGLYAARAGAKTVIAEMLATGGQPNLTPAIENMPGFETIGGAELGERMLLQAETAGCEILYDEIYSIDTENNVIKFLTDEIEYRSLVIATGASPKRLGLEHEEEFIGMGIHFCGLCDGGFYKGKDLVIVGGGNHAVEEAAYLGKFAKSITMIVNIDKLTAQQKLIDEIGKPHIIYNATVKSLVVENNKLAGVVLCNDDVVHCDAVFVCVGRTPNIELFRDKVAVDANGYIIVDREMRTNVRNIFAAGDITQKPVRQVITACADGAIAGTTAAK